MSHSLVVNTPFCACMYRKVFFSFIQEVMREFEHPTSLAASVVVSTVGLSLHSARIWIFRSVITLHVNSYVTGSANGIEVYVANQNSISYDFGSALLQGLISSTNLYNRGMKLNPELRVLKNATMPATLLEMGFISNSEDAALLSESPELFAKGIYNGILDYFDLPSNETPKN